MGPRNLLILFFSTVAVSLVILIIIFSLFFKNVDLNFNTKMPESAPDLGGMSTETSTMPHNSKSDGLTRSTVNVPPSESHEPLNTTSISKEDPTKPADDVIPSDTDLPPISDDIVLDSAPPTPKSTKPSTTEKTDKASESAKTESKPSRTAPAPIAPPVKRPIEKPAPQPAPEPAPSEPLQPLVPPVPSQNQ